MKRLSIIVPMYKVGPYVERCLRSLESQDIPKDEYEIICINDGSPDNSREIVKHLQREFDNIILIDQENKGVSVARNNGIDKANGRYLLFIDPDDYVDNGRFSGILENADRVSAQVSFLGFTFLNEDGTIRLKIFNEEFSSQVYTGIDFYFASRSNGYVDPDRMWAVLFDTKFINFFNLRYLPDVPFLEDGEFIARILCLAERCIFDGRSFYQRTTRPGSATNSSLFNSEKASHGFLAAALNLRKFRHDQILSDRQKTFLNQPICKFVLLAFKSSLKDASYKKYKSVRKELFNDEFKKLELKSVVRPYIYYAYMYNYFNPVFLVIAFLEKFKVKLKEHLN